MYLLAYYFSKGGGIIFMFKNNPNAIIITADILPNEFQLTDGDKLVNVQMKIWENIWTWILYDMRWWTLYVSFCKIRIL